MIFSDHAIYWSHSFVHSQLPEKVLLLLELPPSTTQLVSQKSIIDELTRTSARCDRMLALAGGDFNVGECNDEQSIDAGHTSPLVSDKIQRCFVD